MSLPPPLLQSRSLVCIDLRARPYFMLTPFAELEQDLKSQTHIKHGRSH
jgi:hypothetical protein